MKTKFEFTKNELIKAFKIYNEQMIDNAEAFEEIERGYESAAAQAEHLISILENLPVKENLYDPDLCSDPSCECHTDENKRVLTPLPSELGNPYCCSKCATTRTYWIK